MEDKGIVVVLMTKKGGLLEGMEIFYYLHTGRKITCFFLLSFS